MAEFVLDEGGVGSGNISTTTLQVATSVGLNTIDSLHFGSHEIDFDPNLHSDSIHSMMDSHANNTLTLPYWYNVTFLLNVSRDVPEPLGTLMFGHILPFLLVATLITNILIVIVLAQPHMRTPTNLVLLAMALADLLTLLCPSPWYFYLYTLGAYREPLFPPSRCRLFHTMYEVLPAMFHTYSIWLTLLLAGQRYVYVCHITLARTWCTVSRVTKAMLTLLALSIAHQFARFYDRHFIPIHFQWNDTIVEGCEYLTSGWVNEFIGEDIYYIVYYGFRIIFVHIVPCFLLVLFNVLLLRALHRTQQTRERLLTSSGRKHNVIGESYYSATNAAATHLTVGESGKTQTTTTTCTATPSDNCNGRASSLAFTTTTSPPMSNESSPSAANTNEIKPDVSVHRQQLDEHEDAFEATAVSTTHSGSRSTPVAITATGNATSVYSDATMHIIVSSKRDSNSTTVMLIVIVSLFLLLEIPLTITTILHLVQNTFNILIVDYNALNTIILVTNFFIILSYPINFAIYCGMSRMFRQTFTALFLHGEFFRVFHKRKFGASTKFFAGNGMAEDDESGVIMDCMAKQGFESGREKMSEGAGFTNNITGASSATFGVSSASGCAIPEVQTQSANKAGGSGERSSNGDSHGSCCQILETEL